ncbi:hypothetical protein [Nocardia neocaledoniensis]|uniref:hypothetical protein n=1 Tax=Nocardia neocaledoniensis TaxID=236511 RepID=UPI002456B975|nr:hypothetical protein [Nocardia neocaledoniensis]
MFTVTTELDTPAVRDAIVDMFTTVIGPTFFDGCGARLSLTLNGADISEKVGPGQ